MTVDCPHEADIATLVERSENQKAQIASMTEAMTGLTEALNNNTAVQQKLQIDLVKMDAQHRSAVAITGLLATMFGGGIVVILEHIWGK